MSDVTFAEQLRAHRVAARLTQAELGERAGVSERAVSDIERGLRRRVYPATARALADALDLGSPDRTVFEAAARTGRAPAAAVAGDPVWVNDWRGLRRTPILGRDDELREVLTALHDDSGRLLTITGTGGIGKSRLAAEVCVRIETDAPGRVTWVQLAGLRQPELLLAAVAAAVGVSAAGDGLLAALARALDQRAALLVLDTFEPLLAAAPAVGALLDRTTVVQVLITSRAPLRVRGEREQPLCSLSEPVAAELFRQRARSARPRLGLDDAEAVTLVADICRRLSGLPLALELAAARVRHMSLGALSLEIERPLQLLTDGGRDLPERQQTMRATIEWSHDLLSDDDRVVFRRLAPFAGGWTLDAAERVCDRAPPVIAALGRLCEHGLIQADDAATVARWRMLDPIREYSAEQLADSPDVGAVARGHAEFYRELAEAAAPRLLGAEQAAARAQLRAEVANLRGALGWATQTGAAGVALRLVGALWMFWRMEGAFDEGRAWVHRALDLPDAADSPSRAGALWGAAWLAYQQGELSTATTLGEELLARSTAADSTLDRRNALTILGHIAMSERRFDEALPLLEEALAIARTSDARWHIAMSLLNLGTVLLHHGDPRRAEEVLAEAVAAHDAAGDRHFLARSLVELAYASLVRGDTDLAAIRFADALHTILDLQERWGTAEVVAGFAALAAVRGDAETAAVLTGASDATYTEIAAQVIAPDAALTAPFLAHARLMIGEAQWQNAVDRGRRLSIENAAQLVMHTLVAPGSTPLA